MKSLSTRLIVLLYFLVIGLLISDEAFTQKSYTCADCHSDLMKNEFKHVAVEQKGCNLCHKPIWNDHPGQKKGFELREKMPKLCVNCHPEVADHKWVHSPISGGNCTSCHSPHSSQHKKLLVAEKKKICYSCHNHSLSKDNKPVINMLQLVQTRKFLHAALENGGCTSCHMQHGSDYPKFLIAPFPSGSYAPAVRDSFDLCFQCHDSDLLELQLTTTATNFRNGDKNLHFAHMNGKSARNCTTCHDVHAANYPHLITDKATFGKWELPILFSVSDSGGSCRTGCHVTRDYKR